jgi:hypothetical protein
VERHGRLSWPVLLELALQEIGVHQLGGQVAIAPTLPRLLVEAFGITLGAIAIFWLGWVTHWLLEQRW